MDGIRSGSLISNISSPLSGLLKLKSQLTTNSDLVRDQSNHEMTQDKHDDESMSDLDDLNEDFDGKAPEEVDVHTVSNLAIEVLEGFVSIDPMVTLNQFYQKTIKTNPKYCFKEEPLRSIDGRSFFSFSFTCPITEIVYFSSLPVPLFQDSKSTKLVDLTTKVFGEYRVLKHRVVFSGKKFAKRAVVAAVLEAHNMLDVDIEGQKLFAYNIEQLNGRASDFEISSAVKSEVPATTGLPPISRDRMIPRWVHEVHALGIRADSLSISYKEKLGKKFPRIGEPTKLCCILYIQEPIELKVVGLPSSTKMDALESAIMLLLDETRRQTGGIKYSQDPSTPGHIQVEKKRLLACNPALASYVTHNSNWSTGMLPYHTSTIDLENGGQLFLYTLEFFDSKGCNLATARAGLAKPTPLGVLFTAEIPASPSEQYEARFPIKLKGSSTIDYAVVRLSNGIKLSTLSGSPSTLLSRSRLQHLIMFNREIQDWKSYGLRSPYGLLDSKQATEGKTYMFAPLILYVDQECGLGVDWIMLKDIFSQKQKPYIDSIDSNWRHPLLGLVDLLFVSTLSLVLSLSLLSLVIFRFILEVWNERTEYMPRTVRHKWSFFLESKIDLSMMSLENILVFTKNELNSLFRCFFSVSGERSVWELRAVGALLSISMGSYLCYYFLPPFQNFTDDELSNRFLTHRFKFPRGKLFVTRPIPFRSSRVTGRSKCRSQPCDKEYKDLCQRKWNYDPSTVTFAEGSLKRDCNRVRFTWIPLLQVNMVSKVSDHDPFLEKAFEGKYENVFPEAIMVHSMPKDVLYLLRHDALFMQALEIEMVSSEWALQLTQLSMSISIPLISLPGLVASKPVERIQSLANLVNEACTVVPNGRYQRLEFLGDAVLGYFIALNVMARNSELRWDYDDLNQILSCAGRNTALYDGSLRLGINRILRHEKKEWKSVYRSSSTTNDKMCSMTLETCLLTDVTTPNEMQDIRDKTMSDIAESLLAVAYLDGQYRLISSRSNMVIALLNRLLLPLPPDNRKTEETGWPWFRAMGCCLTSGYPFALDKKWQKQLVVVGTALFTNDETMLKLEQGFSDLVAKLVLLSGQLSIGTILAVQSSKILLLLSIFDDSLKDNSDSGSSVRSFSNGSALYSVDQLPLLERSTSLLSASSDVDDDLSFSKNVDNGLLRAGMTRDTLSFLGASALQLCITHQLFERYPDLQEGGLHVLRALALTDDCVIYIFVKAGFDAFLFDQQAPAISSFKIEMTISDSIGLKNWDARGGWILHGGKEEFARRWTLPSDTPPEPKYMGIGGGRLFSHPTRKLSEAITSDLAFSFKSIIGALVLSIGVDGMWQCIGPLFEELLLLSFDEVRTEYIFSTIVKSS